MLSTCLAYFIVIATTTAVNVALTPIGHQFRASLPSLTWVVNSYSLAFASLLLPIGALADRVGARRVFLGGLMLFVLASGGAAAAPGLAGLVIAQGAAGIAAAALVPTSLALISHTFPAAGERGRAIAFWAATGGGALAAGPVIAGLLIDYAGWRAIFAVQAAIAVAALAVAWARLGQVPRHPRRRADPLGQASSVVGLFALTYSLIEGGQLGWTSPGTVAGFAVAGASFALFTLVERRVDAPILPLELFRHPTFSAATAIGLLINFGYYGQLFVLSLYFETARGFGALRTGLALLPMTATIIVSNISTGRLMVRLGHRTLIAGGGVLCGAGLVALVALGPATPYPVVVPALLAIGLGGGLMVPPMTAALLGTTRPAQFGVASATLNAGRQVGGVVGVAIFGALLAGSGFVTGLHVSVLLAGAGVLCAAALAGFIHRRPAPRTLSEPGAARASSRSPASPGSLP
ncbi:MAG: MFS transporter [Acidimicrobiales bacterium]